MSWFAQCYVDHLVAAVRCMCYRMLNGVCLYNNTCNSITYSQQFQVCIELHAFILWTFSVLSCKDMKIIAFWVDHWFNYCLFCIFDNETTFLHRKVVTSCWGVRVTSIFEHSAIICFSSLWYYVLWLFLLLCFCLIIINVSILTQFKIKWKKLFWELFWFSMYMTSNVNDWNGISGAFILLKLNTRFKIDVQSSSLKPW